MDMTRQIADGHGYLGYLVLAVLVGVVVLAFVRMRDGSDYSEGAPRLAGLLVGLQWAYGMVVYVQIEAWNLDWPLAYVHPLAMTGAVALTGIATARAKRATAPTNAWGTIARFQGIALALLVLGVLAALPAVRQALN